ncbi:unnamed protein product [Cylindrotheca closterium]|uniref:Lcl C-terminal domain-containing protein n=1 Tax=Cylindrotheca closterium TaxID=2856 RepID=A0AAD2PUA4_9STRA|nr:unnamed protein product [Cylindrotheca closterium]
MKHSAIAIWLVSLSTAIASNSYIVTDTNQLLCYDSDSTTSGTGGTVAGQGTGGGQRGNGRRHLDEITCAGTGQDAEYITLSQSFQHNGDGTISDLNTGLMWTEDVYGDGLTYEQVENEVTSFSLGGHSDWRIPTIKELYTLSEFNGQTGTSQDNNIPYIDTAYFNVKYGTTRYIDGQLWSSNQYTGVIFDNPNSECNFGFNSIDGRIKCYGRTSTKLYARYVWGNTNVGTNLFSVSGTNKDIIVDAATGLEWTRGDSDIALDWEEALSYCNDLELSGYTDWKLPDAHQLQSIVDYNRSPDSTGTPAIDPLFESTQITNEAGAVDWGWYWTSTTHLDGKPLGSNAVYIAFGRAMGYFETPNGTVIGSVDVHGAGAQRSDPKVGPVPDPNYFGPQGDYRRVYNFARCVRDSSSSPSKEGAVDVDESSAMIGPAAHRFFALYGVISVLAFI